MPRTQQAVLATMASLKYLLRSSPTPPDFFPRQMPSPVFPPLSPTSSDDPFSPCPFFSIAAVLEEEQAKFAAVPPSAATTVGYDFFGSCTQSNQMQACSWFTLFGRLTREHRPSTHAPPCPLQGRK